MIAVPLILSIAIQVEARQTNLEPENLVPWCIVPFDASERGPAERAEMLEELGLGRCAYDWRPEHVPEFREEIQQYRKRGIEFFAFWGGHEKAFELFKEYDLQPQIWKTLGSPGEGTPEQKIEAAAGKMEPLAKQTAEWGGKLGLYNHGGWGGEPENMVAVCKRLHEKGYDHVGIVYNWHHGHGEIEDWAKSFALMKPYLHCLNLNGMNASAEPKILTLGQGEHELAMLRVVIESGYDGPVGILDHQLHLDSKIALQDNLEGLAWLRKEINYPGSGGKKPVPRGQPAPAISRGLVGDDSESNGVASLSRDFGKALAVGKVMEGNESWRNPPITVECRVRLKDSRGFNILVASDTKTSDAHWEIFTTGSSGFLTAYLPGAKPDHIRSRRVITDGDWHSVGMQYDIDRVKLWVDGEVVADQEIELNSDRKTVAGELAFARLVEGRIGMRGAIDEVRIRRGIHDDLGTISENPFQRGAKGELGYWDFEDPEMLKTPVKERFSNEQVLFERDPLEPDLNPYWEAEINRDRIYDFYAKQALYYGREAREGVPDVLPEFPGLDGEAYGHWGNQTDQGTWKDGRVREMHFGSITSGIFRDGDKTIARAVAVDLGEGFNAVFDQTSLRFEKAWEGAPVEWSDIRRGFLHGIRPGKGKAVELERLPAPDESASYLGLYRSGERVGFSYLENGKTIYRSASVVDGRVIESVSAKPDPGEAQWPEVISTRLESGKGQPFAIDTLSLPYENPWRSLLFASGVDFISENRLAVCTIHGDVWVGDLAGSEITWKRFAAGLHQPLGLKVSEGVVHVMCRDQLVALHDENGDDEADFYECVFNRQVTSTKGHDFITGLERDRQGRWYFASGNEGLCRVSADGRELDVVATGLRNPNGLGVSPDGEVILSSVQEGNWTPASAVVDASWGGHFGAGGPKEGTRGYVPPMLFLPRGLDNSSGGQTFIDSDRWGPVAGNWIHYSSGFASAFLVLREELKGQSQAAAIPLPGEFLSGAHRGRFSPYDGQLYVAGAQGWGNYGTKDGSLQRVRYTGGAFYFPTKYETRENGILLSFAEGQSEELADREKWFTQQWNYLYGPGYGSPEYSVKHPDQPGHDQLEIRSVHRLAEDRVFIEIPQLQPVNQLHLHFAGEKRLEIIATIHEMGEPFTDFPGYQKIAKLSSPSGAGQVHDGELSPIALMKACSTCHHPTQQVVGPPWSDIRERYVGNPDGIVKWAMNPQNKNPDLPPMPSFQFMGKESLKQIADLILSGE
ncbi:MAG: heme-binding domain-containing protein [Verrucomicrobiales bacterium]|nr:heme-binding domain-containing protein [Verrucomicrobiales bacterium]